jgi:hypothetical protein
VKGLDLLKALDIPIPEPKHESAPSDFLAAVPPNPGYRAFFLTYEEGSTSPFAIAIVR